MRSLPRGVVVMDKRPLTAKAISDHAREISDAKERRAYLNDACVGDAELRQRVEALLRANEESSCCPNQPAATLDTGEVAPGQWLQPSNLPAAPLEGVGSRIGPYKLLQQ